jgi:hypothetical protein
MPDRGPIPVGDTEIDVPGAKLLRITADMITSDGMEIIEAIVRDQVIGGGQFALNALMRGARSVDVIRRFWTESHQRRIATLAAGYAGWDTGRNGHGYLGRLISDPNAAPQQLKAEQALVDYLFAPPHPKTAAKAEEQLENLYLKLFPLRYRAPMFRAFQFLRQEVFGRQGGDQDKNWRDFLGAEASLVDDAGPLWTEIELAQRDDPAVAQQRIRAAQHTLHGLSQNHVLAAVLTAYVATKTRHTDRILGEAAYQMARKLAPAPFTPIAKLLQAKADAVGDQVSKGVKAFLELIEPGRFGPEKLIAKRDHALAEMRAALGGAPNLGVTVMAEQSDRKRDVEQAAEEFLKLLGNSRTSEEAVRKLLGGAAGGETDPSTTENAPAPLGSGSSDEQIADALLGWLSPKLAGEHAGGAGSPSEKPISDVLVLRDQMNRQERLADTSRRAAAKEAVLSWLIDNRSSDSVRILDQARNLAADVIAALAANIGEDDQARPDAPVSAGDLNRARSILASLNPNDYLSPGFTDPLQHADELVHWSLNRVAATAAAGPIVNTIGGIVKLVSAVRTTGSDCTFVVVNRSVPAMIRKWQDDGAIISKTPIGEWRPDFIVFTESSGVTQSQLRDFYREFVAPLIPVGGFVGEFAFPRAVIPVLLTETDIGTLNQVAVLNATRLNYCKLPAEIGTPADRLSTALELVAALAELPPECLGYVDIDRIDIGQQKTMNNAGFIPHDRMPVLEWARHVLRSNADEIKKLVATAVANQIAKERAALPAGTDRRLDLNDLRILVEERMRMLVEERTRNPFALAPPDTDRPLDMTLSDREAYRTFKQVVAVAR